MRCGSVPALTRSRSSSSATCERTAADDQVTTGGTGASVQAGDQKPLGHHWMSIPLTRNSVTRTPIDSGPVASSGVVW